MDLATVDPGTSGRVGAVATTAGRYYVVARAPGAVAVPGGLDGLPTGPAFETALPLSIRVDGTPVGVALPDGDDAFEDDDTFATAVSLAPGTHGDRRIVGEDPDYVAVDLRTGDRLDAAVAVEGAGSLRLAAFAPDRRPLAATDSDPDDAAVSLLANATGTYYLVVNGTAGIAPDDTVRYALTVTVTPRVDVAVAPGADGSGQFAVGTTRTYDVVANATVDLGSFDVTVASSNASVLAVTDATATNGTAAVAIAPDNASARVTVPDGAFPAGERVLLARVTVAAVAPGEATLNVTGMPVVRSTLGLDLSTRAAAGTAVTVVNASVGLFPDGIPGSSTGAMPTDTDGNGKLDDMTGDGRFTFQDVIEFVFALDNIAGASLTAAELAALDQDDSGQINFVDVIDLVFQL
jgi:hypothetical protein